MYGKPMLPHVRAALTASIRTHGDTGSREFGAWMSAKRRCFSRKNIGWKNYGGRGITMCKRWRNDYSLFLQDMGRCPPGLTLDRKNNNGNYEPGNCRWATRLQQVHNRRKRQL
jgi:hypothetical protein